MILMLIPTLTLSHLKLFWEIRENWHMPQKISHNFKTVQKCKYKPYVFLEEYLLMSIMNQVSSRLSQIMLTESPTARSSATAPTMESSPSAWTSRNELTACQVIADYWTSSRRAKIRLTGKKTKVKQFTCFFSQALSKFFWPRG